jgi:Uma2 family endonuclease
MSQPASRPIYLTVEEFETYEIPDDMVAELVRGELVLTPGPGPLHGVIQLRLAARLLAFVEQHRLGTVLTAGGFELRALPRTVRVPDIAFISSLRLPARAIPDGLGNLAPDLAVEILSPSDTRARIAAKLGDYEAVHIQLVWLVDPRRRTVSVIARNAATLVLHETDVLDGSTVLPGFSCPVADLFHGLR